MQIEGIELNGKIDDLCVQNGYNGVFDSKEPIQAHLDLLYQIQSKMDQFQFGNFYFLLRSEAQLAALKLPPKVSIFPNRKRLCVHPTISMQQDIDKKCIELKKCPYNNAPRSQYQLQDIEDLKYQFNQSKCCPYYNQFKQSFIIGTHADILNSIRENNSDLVGSLLFFEDCHDLCIKLEQATSITITDSYLKDLCKHILGVKKEETRSQGWEFKFYKKIKTQTINSVCDFNNKHAQMLQPIVSILINLKQNNTSDPSQPYQFIQQYCDICDLETIAKFLEHQGINSSVSSYSEKGLQIQQLTSRNLEAYLQLFRENDELNSQAKKWIQFLRLALSQQDQQQSEQQKSQQQVQSSYEVISVDKSISPFDNLEPQDFKFIIQKDKSIGSQSPNWIQASQKSEQFQKLILLFIKLEVQNIIISSPASYPYKLYRTELNHTISEMASHIIKPVDQFNIGVLAKNIEDKPFDFSKVKTQKEDAESLALSIGKIVLQMHQVMNLVILKHDIFFSSRTFMQKCSEIWTQHQILLNLEKLRNINWLRNTTNLVTYEGFNIFLSKCQQITKQGSLFSHLSDSTLDIMQDVMIRNTKQQKQKRPFTILLIGVPWGAAYLYEQSNIEIFQTLAQSQFDAKLEWLSRQNTQVQKKILDADKFQFDRKYFGFVYAIRTLNRFVHLLTKLAPSNLILFDEKFQWPELWKNMSHLRIIKWENHTETIKYLSKQIKPMVEVKESSITPQNQQQQGLKKIMLNKKFRLSDQFMIKKKPEPNQEESFQNIVNQEANDKEQQKEDEEEGIKCIICWANTNEDNLYKSSHCGHIACHDCWTKWLSTKLECPMCRDRVRQKFLKKLHD